MNLIRITAQAKKLNLDSMAFRLRVEIRKQPLGVWPDVVTKSSKLYLCCLRKKVTEAKTLSKEIVDLIDQHKARYEKDALYVLRLRNLAEDVVRGLNTKL